MCTSNSPTPLGARGVLPARMQRRAILKATAAFGAMAAAGGVIANRSAAQGSTSRANEWNVTMSTSSDGRATTFAADYAFTAVAPHWDGDVEFPAAVEMSLSADGERFSEPVVVGPSVADAGPPDRENRVYGDLLLTEGASYVRYRSLDADGNSILHNSMIVYASGNGDGNAHSHINLPVLVAGRGGGKLHTGRFHKVTSMPMSNMYLEMLGHLGVQGVSRFGDSDNRAVAI